MMLRNMLKGLRSPMFVLYEIVAYAMWRRHFHLPVYITPHTLRHPIEVSSCYNYK